MNILKMLGANFPTPSAPKVLTYIGYTEDSANLTTYTFTGVSIGTASSDRMVVVSIVGDASASRSISSVSIAGSAGTSVVARGAVSTPTAMYRRLVTSGTTATIEVTFSGQMNRAAIYVHTITGLNSNVPEATMSTNTNSAAINGTSGAVVVAFAAILDTGRTSTWTNATKNSENQFAEGFVDSAVASNSSAAASLTITCDWGSTAGRALIGGRWV